MKRSKRKKINKRQGNGICNTHHILWARRDWNKGYANLLRDHWYCKVSIPKDTLHREIHHAVQNIPVPPVKELQEAIHHLAELEEYGLISPDDDIERRVVMLIPLFHGETKQALKRQFKVISDFYYPKRG